MKTVLPFYIHFTQVYLTYSLFLTKLEITVQKTNLRRENNFSSYLDNLNENNDPFAANLFSTCKSIINLNEKENIYNPYCVSGYVEKDEKYEPNIKSSGYYDTLTKDDIVRSQYSLLPYPLVTKEMLAREKYYYENLFEKTKRPYRNNVGIHLEALNHFLFKGRNNFR